MGYEIPADHHQDMPMQTPEPRQGPRLEPDATVAPGWHDISNEAFRVYEFPGGVTVRVDNPGALKVSTRENWVGVGSPDSHRIETIPQEEPNVYIPPGWVALRFAGAYKF